MDESHITVNGKSIRIVSSRDPLQLPWKEEVRQGSEFVPRSHLSSTPALAAWRRVLSTCLLVELKGRC